MCGCDYAKRVHDLLDSLAVEQNRLAADALFATIAAIRGKVHEQHDERSRGISKRQFDALLETANKVKHAHMEEIATLTNKLSDYCGDASAVNNLSDTDCRSALTLACGLVHKYRAAYDAERAVYLYGVMQICAANEMTSEIRTSTSLFQQHVAEHSDKLHYAKVENDALTECVSMCASKLRAQFGDRAARKGKNVYPHRCARTVDGVRDLTIQ
ncbi:hypothetical protein AAVH_23477 [Aphelenchoides avenae]|nr:hypothetical protein AAVH_23477 [Aphelenchus avenae]